MHWGHAVTEDFLHWAYLPCVLAPDTDADKDGCFSGSAVTLPDGRQKLFYTGVTKMDALQVQCAAVGDGRAYEKVPGNPLIDASMLPEGYQCKDFRDPKVWADSEGMYRMLVSARNADGDGDLLLYSSWDSEIWSFTSVLFRGEKEAGVMLECPDLFRLDGWDVLMVSPMGGAPTAFLGTLDREWHFTAETKQIPDTGPDFYAPQTFAMPDGRRILTGWMQNWDTVAEKTKGRKTAGQMTVPRELFIRDQKLCQRPVQELMTAPSAWEETTVFARDNVVTLPAHPDGCAELITLRSETQRYIVLSDRFSLELFCESTGETHSESFAKEQAQRRIFLPGLAAGEQALGMKRGFIG